MRIRTQELATACILCLSTSLLGGTIAGKVTNGTTNQPSAGDDVVLLTLAAGMQETARTRSDRKGQFSFEAPDGRAPLLVRVTHQQVQYFQPAPPGASTVEVTVYDAASKVENVIGEGRVFSIRSAGAGQLEISEMYILRNQSQPPRTWMGDRTLEIEVPEAAQLEEGIAAGPGGMPVKSAPVPAGKPNHYAFLFPIRPGESRLEVVYRLPYGGSRDFEFTPAMAWEEFGVMAPKSMRVSSSDQSFSQDPQDEPGMAVFVAKNVSKGQRLKLSLAGEGQAPVESQNSSAPPVANGSESPSLATTSHSEYRGGLRWYLLGLALVALTGGALWFARGKPAGLAAGHPQPQGKHMQGKNKQEALIGALKDELFQLESDRVQGKISPEEYQTARNGLDTLLRREMT